jgi:dGTP triphosphohydrolase
LLSDPKDPATKNAWCELNEIHADTPKRWKRDKRFNEEWESRAREKNISVDRVQSVVDSLFNAATNGDVKAASLYLQYIDRFTPKRIIRSEDAETKGLSDEDLLAELRQLTEEFQ